MSAPLLTRTLSAAIIDRLRQEILRGDHAPESQLRQDALAAAYGVSRIPVREALLQLESEGLVRMSRIAARWSRRSRATRWRTFSRSVSCWSPSRTLVDPRLTAEDLSRLEALDHAFDEAIERGDAAVGAS